MDDNLRDRSDIYIFRKMEAAVLRGDLVAYRALADELRRRVYDLRVHDLHYHLDFKERQDMVET